MMWGSIVIQIIGLAIDAIWHGLLSPGEEPHTFGGMVAHLGTIHLVLYIGVVSLLLSTGWELVQRVRRSSVGVALPIAFVGSMLQTAAEAWHVTTHLRMHPDPTPEAFAFGGLAVAIVALLIDRRRRGQAPGYSHSR